MPKSPYSSDAASSLLVAWYSNCSSASSSTKSQWLQKLVFVQLHRSLDYTATHRQTVAVMLPYNSILCDLCGDSLKGYTYHERVAALQAPSIQQVSSKEHSMQDALNKPRMPGRDERQQESVRWFAHPFS